MKRTHILILLFFAVALVVSANNGSVALAHPVKNIDIDGDFGDWPDTALQYPLSHFSSSFKSEGKLDLAAYFRIGYNLNERALYVAVEVTDDDFVQNPGDSRWWVHDMQVLYLEPRHRKEPVGVLALEATAYYSKIVEQNLNWDPYVKNASWNMVECEVIRVDNRTRYEWKIILGDHIAAGRTLGFDYTVFDKDATEGYPDTLGWGSNNGIKHECSQCLGDVLLVPSEAQLATLSGKVDIDQKFAEGATLRLEPLTAIENHLDVALDSTGTFTQRVLPGNYRLLQPDRLFWEDPVHLYRLKAVGQETVTLRKRGSSHLELPRMTKLVPRPELIPKRGLLHEPNATTTQTIDDFVTAYMEHDMVPGVSLMVIREGKPWYYKTYGVQNRVTGEPITKNTLFEGASMTKPIFAYVASLMAERNQLDLQRPLHEYLAFPELEEYPDYKKMTAYHVLSHKSGMPNWGRNLLREPGIAYGYSGEAFEYLKRVIEKITSRDIEDIIREELIKPQNIGRMEFKRSSALRQVFSRGHIDGTPSIRVVPEEPMVAYSLHTEARAYTDFALTLLERRGLKTETYNRMMRIHSTFPDNRRETDHAKEGMGLGIAISESKFGKMFYHSGNSGDFKCLFRVYEDLKMGFVVFTNSNTGNFLADDLALLLVEGKKK